MTKPRPGAHKGRPTVWTPELERKILDLLKLGLPYDSAAVAAGISPSTLYDHKARFPDFLEACHIAEAQSEAILVGRVVKASEKDWKAAMALMERRWAHWARRDNLNVNHSGTVDLTLARLHEIRARAEARKKEATKRGPPQW